MSKNSNRFLALLLTVFVFCSSVISVHAAESIKSDSALMLDDGTVLNVPVDAVDDSIMVIKYHRYVSSDYSLYRYIIYDFERLGFNFSLYTGKECFWDKYSTDSYTNKQQALENGSWSVVSESGPFDPLETSNFEIVYSSFDFYDSEDLENLLYPASVRSPDSNESDIFVSPVRNYSGFLPSVSSVSDSRKFDHWAVFRFPADRSYQLENDLPIYNSDTEWTYWLLFFSDDFSFVTDTFTDYHFNGIEFDHPFLSLSASTIYRYRLTSEMFSDHSITDSVLETSAGCSSWEYYSTYNNDFRFGSSLCTIPVCSNQVAYENLLCNIFVASSESVFVDKSGPWFKQLISDSPLEQYFIPSISWMATFFDPADSGGSDLPVEENEISWLKRIYNAIISGFDSVLDKIGSIGSGADPDSPELNTPVGGEDEENPDSGFSLLDIIKTLFGFFTDVLGGLFGLIFDMLTDLVSSVGDFFSMISDSTSEIFSLFDDESGAFNDAKSFYGFMSDLWLCVPTPIQQFFYFSFGLTLFFVLLKMFH